MMIISNLFFFPVSAEEQEFNPDNYQFPQNLDPNFLRLRYYDSEGITKGYFVYNSLNAVYCSFSPANGYSDIEYWKIDDLSFEECLQILASEIGLQNSETPEYKIYSLPNLIAKIASFIFFWLILHLIYSSIPSYKL